MKGFIFDLDGTLLDSLGLWQDIDKKYMAMHDIEYKRAYTDEIKRLTYIECAYYFKNVLGIKKEVEEIQKDWREMSHAAYQNELPLKPFAFEFVRECAKEGKCIVATSCFKESAVAALKRTGLFGYMEDIITTDEVGFNKENPKIYEICAEKLGLKPEECYVFEDVYGAALCASKAHFKVIGIMDDMWMKDRDEMKKICLRTIDSFKELMDENMIQARRF